MAVRRIPPPPAPTGEAVPGHLLAGACREVWGADARRRWQAARRDWLAAHGIDPTDYAARPAELRDGYGRGIPWSYLDALADGSLSDRLRRLGLPADWTPTQRP